MIFRAIVSVWEIPEDVRHFTSSIVPLVEILNANAVCFGKTVLLDCSIHERLIRRADSESQGKNCSSKELSLAATGFGTQMVGIIVEESFAFAIEALPPK